MLIFEDFFDDIDIDNEVQDDKVDVSISNDEVVKFVPMD